MHPWWPRDAIDAVDKILKDSQVGFEWGSGCSTVWLSERTKHLITVEHNPDWFKKVLSMTNGNTTCLLRENGEYASVIEHFPDESFDYIHVDGLKRNDCVKRAISKLRTGGFLILDDSERIKWSEGRSLLRDAVTIGTGKAVNPFTGNVAGIAQETLLWFK